MSKGGVMGVCGIIMVENCNFLLFEEPNLKDLEKVKRGKLCPK